MNKPEINMADEATIKTFDDHQFWLTCAIRELEAEAMAMKELAAPLMKSNPGLYGKVFSNVARVAELHRRMSALQKDVYAQKLLSKPHADCVLPWLTPELEWTHELIPEASGGCKG